MSRRSSQPRSAAARDRGFTRRAALGRAGAAAALAAGAPLWRAADALGQGTPPATPPPRLRKCLSMGGFAPLSQPGHAQDVRLHGNLEFIRDLSGTRWVKLWVSWRHLQEGLAPHNRAESWESLNRAPAGRAALRILDAQVAALNADARRTGRIGVILTLYQDAPSWASSASARHPDRGGRRLEARVPDDLSPSGPWAWFVGHLIARYRRGAAPNPNGPRALGPAEAPPLGHDASAGNPDGGAIDALEICNEPNLLLWPQRDLPARVADMVETAAELAAAPGGPLILAPATADTPDPPHDGRTRTDWRTFTDALLRELAERRLAAPVAWSHHNYKDVGDEVDAASSRVREVVRLLDRHGWRGAGGPRLWLTEGGLNLAGRSGDPRARRRQAEVIERNFAAMASIPDVFMWTQHTIHDVVGNAWHSGLRDEFRYGFGPGPARPAWHSWRALPGSPTS